MMWRIEYPMKLIRYRKADIIRSRFALSHRKIITLAILQFGTHDDICVARFDPYLLGEYVLKARNGQPKLVDLMISAKPLSKTPRFGPVHRPSLSRSTSP